MFVLLHANFAPPDGGADRHGLAPFALVGGLWLVADVGFNLSVAVAVGFIALAGVAAETGVVMLVYLEAALAERRRTSAAEGRAPTVADVNSAVMSGAVERLRRR